MKKLYHTDYLFSKSSFLDGLGSIFNISGNYYNFNYSKTEEEADSKAIKNDWGVVGDDIREAQNKLRLELSPKLLSQIDSIEINHEVDSIEINQLESRIKQLELRIKQLNSSLTKQL
ncbi:MAG: hypothetical protein R2753_02280 [Chitinophagales bacterium]